MSAMQFFESVRMSHNQPVIMCVRVMWFVCYERDAAALVLVDISQYKWFVSCSVIANWDTLGRSSYRCVLFVVVVNRSIFFSLFPIFSVSFVSFSVHRFLPPILLLLHIFFAVPSSAFKRKSDVAGEWPILIICNCIIECNKLNLLYEHYFGPLIIHIFVALNFFRPRLFMRRFYLNFLLFVCRG